MKECMLVFKLFLDKKFDKNQGCALLPLADYYRCGGEK
jgi:hypothetical protein